MKLVQPETFTTWKVLDQHCGDCSIELPVSFAWASSDSQPYWLNEKVTCEAGKVKQLGVPSHASV